MQLCVLKITEGSSKDPRFCYIVYDCHLMSLNCDLLGLYSNVIASDLWSCDVAYVLHKYK